MCQNNGTFYYMYMRLTRYTNFCIILVREEEKLAKKSDKSMFKYVPVYPQAPLDMKFHYYDKDGVLKVNKNMFELVNTPERLKEIFDQWKGKTIAVDTETTGLTFFKDFTVGFSVAVDKNYGIYVPIRHQIRRVDKVKETRLDKDGNIVYTKTGKKSTVTKEYYTDFENPINMDPKTALDMLFDLIKESKLTVFFNAEFDLTMLKNDGYDIIKAGATIFDASILTYLYDAENRTWNNLKSCSHIVLGRKPTKFEEALGGAANFRFVDLDEGYPYAAADAANTIGIYYELGPKVRELLSRYKAINIDGCDKPYNVYHRDNELIKAFTDYYHHVNLIIDTEAAKEYKKNAEKELAETEEKIYKYFDMGNFNLNTQSKEFQHAVSVKHIDTGFRTETGNVSYGKKGIEEMSRKLRALKEILKGFKYMDYKDGKLNKRASTNELKLAEIITTYGKRQFKFVESVNYLQHMKSIEGVPLSKKDLFEELKLLWKSENEKLDILKTIQKRSKLVKALNSYIDKLCNNETCHMHYNLKGTASGRLSSGNGSKNEKKKNHYFIDLNAQNLTKPHSAFYKAYRSEEEGNILGWKFEMVTEDYMHAHKDEEIIVEGSDPASNIRNCLIAPKGRYIASLDYSAQEYRVLAILSRDHKMIDNFKKGIDPHTATAWAIWGEEHYDRQKRKKAKGCVGDNTLISTTRGQVSVNNLLPTDKLIGVDGKPQNYVMTDYVGDLIDIEWSNGLKSSFTPNHPVQVWDGTKVRWKAVSCLTKDDEVISYVGNYNTQCLNPLSFTKKVGHVNVIETENHTYIADGVGSHNCNFLMNYCGGPKTLAENLDIPFEEALDIIKKYEKAYFECIEWKKREQQEAINNRDGVAFTPFGRPRQFKSVISSSYRMKDGTQEYLDMSLDDRLYKSAAIYKAVERKIVSHLIQGTCGDICRWDLIRLYRRFFKGRDPHIDFYSTVHDEINFVIDKEYTVDYVREIDDIMTIHRLSKDLPIVTSIDLGYTLGVLFPFEWEDETRTNLVPLRV